MSLSLLARLALLLDLPKTLYFNFRCLPLRTALVMPIFVSRHVVCKRLRGKVILKTPARTAMIRIGYGDVAVFDRRRSRTIWSNAGRVVFAGRADIGHGSRISVEAGGELWLGDRFHINAESTIVCKKGVRFGDDCLLSWDVLVMDSDYHKLLAKDGSHRNPDEEVVVGDHVWIGCRCLLNKGTRIASGSVVAAQSVVTGTFSQENVLLAGSPARIVGQGISWER